MYSVSDKFVDAIKKPSRYIKSKITIGDTVIEGEDISNYTLEDKLVTGEDFEIGTAIMTILDIDLINENKKFDKYIFENKELFIEIGIELEDKTIEYVPLGYFIVDNVTKNGKLINLETSDRMAKFEKEYKTNIQFPAKLIDIAKDICNKAGTKFKNTRFVNSDYIVEIKPDFTDLTLRKAISYVSELAGGYSRISRNGELEIFNVENKIQNYSTYIGNENISKNSYLFNDVLKQNEIKITRDNYFTLSNKENLLITIDKVIIKSSSIEVEKGDGDNSYEIVDNIFCQNPNALIDKLYEQISKIAYIPFVLTWQGNPSLDLGDPLTIRNNASIYNTFATERKLTYSGGLKEEYTASLMSNAKKESTPKGNIAIEVGKVKTEIKVLDGKIEQKVSNDEFETYIGQTEKTIELMAKDISGNTKEVSQLKITAGEIEQSVSKKVGEEEVKSIITQNPDKVRVAFNGVDSYTQISKDGLKINNGHFQLQNGNNVVIIDGNHNIHKIISEGTAQINFTGENKTITIKHNLGYKPAFSSYQNGANGADEYTSLPALTWNDGSGVVAIIRSRCDSNNLYFDFMKKSDYTIQSITIYIKYFIYKEVAF
ncbi:MAG: hypothetical protein E6248_00525 [Clostridium sp.]|uniref:hypothetical protein n=1 Tax=Clostridium sp. TaxID=1506 RepID=UPI002908E43F|nr:hypothetical protein [Clostridium sp.]MDU5108901.1 hypothetical protein [Clostridium sp.]